MKNFSWSYSKLKNFESCPKRHLHVDIKKDVKEEESEELQWGNALHKAMALRCGPKRTPLSSAMAQYESWCERVITPPGKILVEQKLAITSDFSPCSWFGDQAWFRAIGDVVKINGPVALIVDWKTGKIVEDSQQLALMAACVFAHYPEVKAVRSVFVWLKEDAETPEVFKRDEMSTMWRNIWPRIENLKHAYETNNYPALPGRLCRNWCPVKACEHNGV